jgi:hypothetical protein
MALQTARLSHSPFRAIESITGQGRAVSAHGDHVARLIIVIKGLIFLPCADVSHRQAAPQTYRLRPCGTIPFGASPRRAIESGTIILGLGGLGLGGYITFQISTYSLKLPKPFTSLNGSTVLPTKW